MSVTHGDVRRVDLELAVEEVLREVGAIVEAVLLSNLSEVWTTLGEPERAIAVGRPLRCQHFTR